MQDVYICDYIRTPIGRYGGALAAVRTDDLAAIPLRALAERNAGLDPANVEEVILGCTNQAGEDNRNVARMALLLADYPDSVPGITVNRLCASGMDAVIAGARAIQTGAQDLVIAGGVESMTRAPFVMPKPEAAFTRKTSVEDTTIGWRFVNPRMQASYGTNSMPETAENVAEEFSVGRADQDRFAYRSQQKAGAAQESGRLAEEIVPVAVPQRRGAERLVGDDEHIRADTTLEKLAALHAPFRQGGSVTAGNASGVNDGAAALLLASEAACTANGLIPLARVVIGASAALAPRIMGYGPVPAIEKILRKSGIALDDLGVLELNEAFASQALATLRALGLADDDPRVNPNGGAIALGHPLGMSGARITGTAALEMQRQGHRHGMAAMCVGIGQGAAVLLAGV